MAFNKNGEYRSTRLLSTCGKKGHIKMDNVCLPTDVEAHEKKHHEAQQKKSDAPTAPPNAPAPAPAPAAESSEQMLHFGAMGSMDEENYALTLCTLTEARKPRTVLDKVIEQSQAKN